MQNSPRLALSYLQPQQAQKHVTANDSFRRLDAIVQLSAKSRSVAAEPASPAEGDAYILPAGKTGAAWAGMAVGAVAAYQDGAWSQLTPGAGWRCYVEDAGETFVYKGGLWVNEAALGAEATFRKLTVSYAGFLQNASISDGSYQTFAFDTYSGAQVWHQPYLQARRARGSLAAPAAVLNGDAIFTFDMYGHDGSGFIRLGAFGYTVGGAVSTGIVPGAANIKLMDTAGTMRQILTLAPTRATIDGPLRVKSYLKAALPTASAEGAGAILYVSDEAGGAVLAFSDAVSWRRVTDRAVVS